MTNIKLDYDFLNEKFKEIDEKMERRPYPDGRYKKGFVMRLFNPKTGQFVQGYGVGNNYNKRRKQ